MWFLTTITRLTDAGGNVIGAQLISMDITRRKEAEEQVERSGEIIVAIYHSHVGADVYLSEIDVEYIEDERFPYREAAQIVVAVLDQQVHGAGIFEREGIDTIELTRGADALAGNSMWLEAALARRDDCKLRGRISWGDRSVLSSVCSSWEPCGSPCRRTPMRSRTRRPQRKSPSASLLTMR